MQTFVCICVVGAQPLKIHDSENTKDFIVVKINRVLKQGKLAIKAIICPSCTCMFCSLMFLLPYLVLSRFLFLHQTKRCWNIQTASCYCVFHLHTVYEKLALFANVLFSYTNCVLAHGVWTSCRSCKNEHLNPFLDPFFSVSGLSSCQLSVCFNVTKQKLILNSLNFFNWCFKVSFVLYLPLFA